MNATEKAKALRAEAALTRAEAERRALALEALADAVASEAKADGERMVDGAEFGISVTTWRRAVRAGETEGAMKLGKAYVAPHASVEKWSARGHEDRLRGRPARRRGQLGERGGQPARRRGLWRSRRRVARQARSVSRGCSGGRHHAGEYQVA